MFKAASLYDVCLKVQFTCVLYYINCEVHTDTACDSPSYQFKEDVDTVGELTREAVASAGSAWLWRGCGKQ